jgi:hypothetical protein
VLKVTVEDTSRPLEQVVDEDIKNFEVWFREHLHNGDPLVRSEKAILKTYLRWKTRDPSAPVRPSPKEKSDA